MRKDPIVEHDRKARAAFAAGHGNDINAMRDALAPRKDSVAAYVKFSPKHIASLSTRRTAKKVVAAIA